MAHCCMTYSCMNSATRLIATAVSGGRLYGLQLPFALIISTAIAAGSTLLSFVCCSAGGLVGGGRGGGRRSGGTEKRRP